MADVSPAMKAYGPLWRSPSIDHFVFEARQLLLNSLESDARKEGIKWATETYGRMTAAELLAADIRCGGRT